MKISTKGRYGLRALVDLAVNSNGEHVALSEIADRQNISMNYLEQVFASLRKAGLINSVKGAQGGYIFAKSPSSITVGDVLRVLEGNLSLADDSKGNFDEKSVEYCLKTMVWDRMENVINEFVDSIAIEDLANEYRRINGNESSMYYI
ncbi:MAG: RrF2 family transcriptional regulator [Clostridiaceae bacterium]|nr:RrF2 family transcriptional regulator [Clostridiaceae bacterium]